MEKLSSASQKLTPFEIKNKEFKRSLWGYSPKEVVEFLDETACTWEAVQKHEKELLLRIRDLESNLEAWKTREQELDKLRENAQEEAKVTMQEAAKEASRYFEKIQEKAEEIRVKTESWLERVLSEVEETEKKKEAYLNSLKTTLDQHYALLDSDEDKHPLAGDLQRLLQDVRQ